MTRVGELVQAGRGLDDADEVLEEVLLLLLHEAALDAESGLGEVLADVVLDALRPDAAYVEIKSRPRHRRDDFHTGRVRARLPWKRAMRRLRASGE